MKRLVDNGSDWAWGCRKDGAHGEPHLVWMSQHHRQICWFARSISTLTVLHFIGRFISYLPIRGSCGETWLHDLRMVLWGCQVNHEKKKKKKTPSRMPPGFLLSESHPDWSCFQCLQSWSFVHNHQKRKKGTLFSCPSAFCLSVAGWFWTDFAVQFLD